MHKPVHPIFNNRTRPVLIWGVFLSIFIAFYASVPLFWAWHDMSSRGTVHGKIIDVDNTAINNRPVSYSPYSPFPKYQDAVRRIKIEWYAGIAGGWPNTIVLTSVTDTYQYINQIPAGYLVTVTTIFASGARTKDSVRVKRDGIPTQLDLIRAPDGIRSDISE